MMKKDLFTPTKEFVLEKLEDYKTRNDGKDYHADVVINNQIKLFDKNVEINEVLSKVVLINSLYSTNMYSTYKMAQHIVSLNTDELISNSDLRIVDKIANEHKIPSSGKLKKRSFYSFATKYCSWHNQECFPIYDSKVERALKFYNQQKHFLEDTNFKDYTNFKNCILAFKREYSLEEFSLKEIDKFLWLVNEQIF